MTRPKGAKESETQFTAVENTKALEELFERSRKQPIVLFKHSTTCPISASAHRQMAELSKEVAGRIALVVVQRARELSRRVAELTGIQHESPQTIILRNGQAVWSASHFDITTTAVEQAVLENK